MSGKEMEVAPRQQSQPPRDGANSKSTNLIVTNLPDDVKALRALRSERRIPVADIVEVITSIYPKFDRYLLSKAEHGDEYGIRLRGDAMDALLVKYEPSLAKPRKKEQRTKGYRVQCRLSLERYIQFQRSVRAANTSIQSVLETAVVNFINQNQREDSHDQTAQ